MEEWPTKSFLELCKACLLTLKCKKGFLASTIAHGTCIGFILEWWMTGFSRFKKECFKKFTYLWQMRCRSDMKCVTNYEWTVTTYFGSDLIEIALILCFGNIIMKCYYDYYCFIYDFYSSVVSLAWRLDQEMRRRLIIHETGFTRESFFTPFFWIFNFYLFLNWFSTRFSDDFKYLCGRRLYVCINTRKFKGLDSREITLLP